MFQIRKPGHFIIARLFNKLRKIDSSPIDTHGSTRFQSFHLKPTFAQDFYSGFYLGSQVYSCGKRRRTKNVTQKVAMQHIITSIKNPTYPIASCKYPATRPGSIIDKAIKAVQMA